MQCNSSLEELELDLKEFRIRLSDGNLLRGIVAVTSPGTKRSCFWLQTRCLFPADPDNDPDINKSCVDLHVHVLLDAHKNVREAPLG